MSDEDAAIAKMSPVQKRMVAAALHGIIVTGGVRKSYRRLKRLGLLEEEPTRAWSAPLNELGMAVSARLVVDEK